ncbi:DivIVA domain-containing protein [Diplocloster agilis]|uniref:DivIVA domain-containing protein n=1 Tax=Diplocloster agilis TaxID=2850323 RepID=A0A949JZB0_9FIRM|nr:MULTISPECIES: DivIVA domain-containing protein [Lachnospiraceae]MBU9736946.1 DivIVA domain-containing protein [Diplocloster agilis]MCU6733258.1 DivIVA domain-containing protein [Suonthocola fibrivorans]SCI82934.1 cell division protein GpsB [uncultured Clostridium sp.]
MKITAQEILKKEFDRKMKGYSPIEVDQFLDEIIASMEEGEKEYKAGLSALQTQVDGLISEKAALEAQIDELKAQQEEDKKNQLLLKKALAMSKKKEQDYMEKAQEKVKSLMDAAHSAADQVNREAQTKARQIVMEANESAKKTEAEVEDRVRMMRAMIENQQTSVRESHKKYAEIVQSQKKLLEQYEDLEKAMEAISFRK